MEDRPLGDGLAKVDVIGKEELIFSEKYSCPDCGISIEELTPRMFSFNNPYGACPCCSGLGMLMKIDPDIIVPDKSLSLNQNAINVKHTAERQKRRCACPTCTFGPG